MNSPDGNKDRARAAARRFAKEILQLKSSLRQLSADVEGKREEWVTRGIFSMIN